jgi:hypothetical protein
VLSALTGLIIGILRGRGARAWLPRGKQRTFASLLRPVALTVATAGLGALVRRAAGLRVNRCEDDAREADRRCARYEDRGYNACSRYEDQGYNACSRYEDQGYNACSRYEDRGYNSCREWRKNCCDWWPCSWACEVFSWFCFAWVWISHVVCVAWYWISHVVCVAWYWVTHFVCVLWVWVSHLVCVLWLSIVFPACTFLCLLRRLFAGNEVSTARSECIYSWTSAYRITEESDCRLAIVLRIRLQPDSGISAQALQAAQTTWEQAIERAWTGQFPIRRSRGNCPCAVYRVTLDVQWVTSGEHHTVRVRAGSGRADMGNWFITSTGGTVAHEAGHMLGNPDEYADPACPSRTVTSDNSIMQISSSGTVRARHYQGFANWISARTCCDYAVALD